MGSVLRLFFSLTVIILMTIMFGLSIENNKYNIFKKIMIAELVLWTGSILIIIWTH